MALPERPAIASGNGNHVVVRDNKFLCLVAELRDGNFVAIFPNDTVYPSLDAAISAALNRDVPNPEELNAWQQSA